MLNYFTDACPGPVTAVATYLKPNPDASSSSSSSSAESSFGAEGEIVARYYFAISRDIEYDNNMQCSYSVCPAHPSLQVTARLLSPMVTEATYDFLTFTDADGNSANITGTYPAVR